MYEKLSRDELTKKLLEIELERNALIKLYLVTDGLVRDLSAYVIEILTSKVELEDEISDLTSDKPFNSKEYFERIKTELKLKELKEKKTKSSDDKENF
ncbi:hypothetical protein [Aliarcobacter butzleri]|uniref:hypothetical protein n=1 Tax=Aliarcobacter butzleri TaxID=28197 RepID=UPI0012611DF2|nr:hypothetical protein [Aliarcobacter butzleri]MCG3658727.1 hypothetical protein [Aliarcobacter butzleri]